MPIAAVTGASRGIGRATAIALAGAGYRVFALARSMPDLEAVARNVPTGSVVPIELDITDNRSREAALRQVIEETGGYGLDVLVNNAGYGQEGAIEEVSVEAMRRQFEVNVFGLVAFTQPFIPAMRERGQGRVVNISSAAGRFSTPFEGVYSASKFALEAISDAMRRELRPFGIAVILIEPGPIRTDFGRVAGENEVWRENSPYAARLARFRNAQTGNRLFSRSADTVAQVVVRAVQAQHPRPRYVITIPARLAELGRYVPDRVVDAVLARLT
ncbi:MAG TPA: SDR family oxidoreductase [Chloroflexota bacterium]|nr:SDR family oxidoreductase [Chloroflexota bacterium]